MYSQFNEDDLFMPLLPASGRLMEIGAWDPVTFSNSRALIERGWRATLIEPSPGPLQKLIREYSGNSDVQIIGGAVTTAEAHGCLINFEVTDDAVSAPASAAEHNQQWRSSGGYYGHMWTCAISLRALFAQLGGDFDFISFDVEGGSFSLFEEMCRLGPRPLVVVVEHDSRFVEIAQVAEKANYRQVHLNGTNVILQWTGTR